MLSTNRSFSVFLYTPFPSSLQPSEVVFEIWHHPTQGQSHPHPQHKWVNSTRFSDLQQHSGLGPEEDCSHLGEFLGHPWVLKASLRSSGGSEGQAQQAGLSQFSRRAQT